MTALERPATILLIFTLARHCPNIIFNHAEYSVFDLFSSPQAMDSRLPTLKSASSPWGTTPTPPAHLFRTVKRLSAFANKSNAVFLCLPRELPPPFIPETSRSYGLPSPVAKVHAAFKKQPEARMRQQVWLLEYPRASDAIFHSMNFNGVSGLTQEYVKVLPQLVVVKMGVAPAKIRKEGEIIEILHRGREYSTLHIGSSIVKSQITSEASSSWLCLRPNFAPTLAQFGEASVAAGRGGIPSWFVAHTFLGLVDAVDFLHKDGIMHNRLYASNVMLNLYPSYIHHRYRGYPDIQLIDFSCATTMAESGSEKDTKGLLWVVEQVVTKWSDSAPFLAVKAAREDTDDPTVLVLRDIQEVLGDDAPFGLKDIKQNFVVRVEKLRNTGPETIPRYMMKLLHADLATEEELESAFRKLTVLKFETRREEFRRIVKDVPLMMGTWGHAGMKGKRIMVMRFTTRKADFLRTIGEGYVEDETSMDMNDTEMSGVEMADDETRSDSRNMRYPSLFWGI
ncbi:uncharacterized protein K460DRAFT_368144 [Cucurbitaria berberidis CBS 394.84]|uniref:Protein kinase domain-containing protein n=1 Tax=Cucurbitaria berberidis CBS 394.84 TaxID=1168544 RepID=A0A9P4GD75_9PLEO|nr:uncharacterized protein K460DRAFT_368144 [Cucurbitaria berberidis CBS 394.84]KAF1843237.1 hypothetical protein K460DRAFT_368144 [Cucurbitaria berberidis CBS 394.84]